MDDGRDYGLKRQDKGGDLGRLNRPQHQSPSGLDVLVNNAGVAAEGDPPRS